MPAGSPSAAAARSTSYTLIRLICSGVSSGNSLVAAEPARLPIGSLPDAFRVPAEIDLSRQQHAQTLSLDIPGVEPDGPIALNQRQLVQLPRPQPLHQSQDLLRIIADGRPHLAVSLEHGRKHAVPVDRGLRECRLDALYAEHQPRLVFNDQQTCDPLPIRERPSPRGSGSPPAPRSDPTSTSSSSTGSSSGWTTSRRRRQPRPTRRDGEPFPRHPGGIAETLVLSTATAIVSPPGAATGPKLPPAHPAALRPRSALNHRPHAPAGRRVLESKLAPILFLTLGESPARISKAAGPPASPVAGVHRRGLRGHPRHRLGDPLAEQVWCERRDVVVHARLDRLDHRDFSLSAVTMTAGRLVSAGTPDERRPSMFGMFRPRESGRLEHATLLIASASHASSILVYPSCAASTWMFRGGLRAS